jgi:hypothetical protein
VQPLSSKRFGYIPRSGKFAGTEKVEENGLGLRENQR